MFRRGARLPWRNDRGAEVPPGSPRGMVVARGFPRCLAHANQVRRFSGRLVCTADRGSGDLRFQAANPLLADGSKAAIIGILRFVCREATFLPYGLIPRKPFSIGGRWTILLPVAGVERRRERGSLGSTAAASGGCRGSLSLLNRLFRPANPAEETLAHPF
jgi:hypothetical protein